MIYLQYYFVLCLLLCLLDGFLVVETRKLTKIGSEMKLDCVGKPILQSLREQRRKNLLCDVSIQCGKEHISAHRCVLYSMSKYCRTLFTGSIPPTYRGGILIMDLNLFSSDAVVVLLDLIYGEETSM